MLDMPYAQFQVNKRSLSLSLSLTKAPPFPLSSQLEHQLNNESV
jgi:hypothetical protein